MREAVIVSTVRTPVGRARGALASVPAHKLGGLVVKEAVRRSGIDPAEIDDLIFGNLMANELLNAARVVSLEAGLPFSVPAVTLDRQCASSLNAYINACVMIEAGHADAIVAGGVESDSRRSYVMEKPSAAYQIMPPQWAALMGGPTPELNPSMIETAENVAAKLGITRKACDEFAARSHERAAKAWDAGRFDEQIVPVPVDMGKGQVVDFAKDEILRPDTTVDALAKLKPVAKPDGVVTAGNSSPLSDGAGAMVVMERSKAEAMGLVPLARLKAFAAAGVDPRYMGLGPVAATQRLFKRSGLSMKDIDLIELNEAFAAQTLGCVLELGIDEDKLNVNGGAIALGHPLAGTGAILIAKMVYELRARDLSLGLVTFCIGGGQGLSAVIERA
jgi:acetyl-CoA acyltransferase